MSFKRPALNLTINHLALILKFQNRKVIQNILQVLTFLENSKNLKIKITKSIKENKNLILLKKRKNMIKFEKPKIEYCIYMSICFMLCNFVTTGHFRFFFFTLDLS